MHRIHFDLIDRKFTYVSLVVQSSEWPPPPIPMCPCEMKAFKDFYQMIQACTVHNGSPSSKGILSDIWQIWE